MRHVAPFVALLTALAIVLACSGGGPDFAAAGGGGSSLCTYADMPYTTWDFNAYSENKFLIHFAPDGEATRDSYRGSYDVNEGTWTLSGNKFKADFGGTVLSFEKLDGCTMGGSVTFAGESEGIPYRASRKWPACGC
ncbi:MAG: hypothetical protein JRJ84_19695 [Deltaproteobacteria bacterium]|nr:hypothetical protein [Deltaproteobacteria bacterium]